MSSTHGKFEFGLDPVNKHHRWLMFAQAALGYGVQMNQRKGPLSWMYGMDSELRVNGHMKRFVGSRLPSLTSRNSVPLEILTKILTYLDLRSVMVMTVVSAKFYCFFFDKNSNTNFWRHYRVSFGFPSPPPDTTERDWSLGLFFAIHGVCDFCAGYSSPKKFWFRRRASICSDCVCDYATDEERDLRELDYTIPSFPVDFFREAYPKDDYPELEDDDYSVLPIWTEFWTPPEERFGLQPGGPRRDGPHRRLLYDDVDTLYEELRRAEKEARKEILKRWRRETEMETLINERVNIWGNELSQEHQFLYR
ncbi:hypothetical protein E1B28_011924 [Marasmius oreades]|uniref:F-box domain-containing protein n=1 Tax=Marasmius oreades TaxID=181124 RepID=A0A9P7RWJ8_9AGAR|nr:uncharacterized protein E1B28_011924 [Marasmius oreades]KAG7090328.1 hypothetical protein E1B28_011924 [Marasmius oreades]